MYFEDLDRRMP